MKKEFTLENLKSIEIDKTNNCVIAHYEEEKPALKVGEWYLGSISKTHRLILSDSTCYDIDAEGVHSLQKECHFNLQNSINNHTPADMQEVKKLLIKEAEKIGFKPYEHSQILHWLITESGLHMAIGRDESMIVFDFKTGKWAVTMEKEKPLCTNCYDREYFGGETEWWFVRNDGTAIYPGQTLFRSSAIGLGLTNSVAFYGTERECHQYLADNWDKLNKK